MRHVQRSCGGVGPWLLVPCLAFMLLSPAARAQSDYVPVLVSGSPDNRINVAFLGDGYTASELETLYPEHIQATLRHFFDSNQEPFPRYRNFFNVYRINVTSAESGATDPTQGTWRNTALGARYNYDGVNAYALYMDSGRVTVQLAQAFQNASFVPNATLVAVNSDRAGGASGMYACFSAGFSQGPEIALHEFGHVFANLADEYGGSKSVYAGLEPPEVNITTSADGGKWSRWLGFEQSEVGLIGAYEGGGYYDYGMYSPARTSKMRYLGFPFNAVCREKIILDIYRWVRPLDGWRDNAQTIVDPESLWVKPVDPAVIKVQWQVNGKTIRGLTGETFRATDVGFEPGIYTITARAFDPTDWVREHQDLLEQTVSWTVQFTTSVARTRAPDAAQAATDSDTGPDPYVPMAAGEHKGSWTTLGADTVSDLFSMANGSICGIASMVPMGTLLLGMLLISGGSPIRAGRKQ